MGILLRHFSLTSQKPSILYINDTFYGKYPLDIVDGVGIRRGWLLRRKMLGEKKREAFKSLGKWVVVHRRILASCFP